MAENINFISANELPEAVGDEISVLCVENGQMKRKSGSLGGGAYVIDLRGNEELNLGGTASTITSVNYDDFAEHWWKGGSIVFLMEAQGLLALLYPLFSAYNVSNKYIAFGVSLQGTAMNIIFANGTWTPPTE